MRGDRTPEYSTIDLETSFLSAEEILDNSEGLIAQVMHDVKGIDVDLPLLRNSWTEAMEQYGSEQPDLRFDMQITDVSDFVKDTDLQVFAGAVTNGGQVLAIVLPGGAAQYSRQMIDATTDYIKRFGE